MELKYPHLFTPLQVGSAVFRNRIFASPQGFYRVAADNLPNGDEAAFYERKALGGFAASMRGRLHRGYPDRAALPFLCD